MSTPQPSWLKRVIHSYPAMVAAIDRAKRALVTLLLALASKYNVVLDLRRESADEVVRKAFRKVSLKTHPDRGGDPEEQKKLNAANDAWQAARNAPKQKRGGWNAGRQGANKAPKSEGLATTSPRARQRKAHEKGYRIRSTGSLLTYQKFADAGVWLRFVSFVEQFLERHGIRHWCATMETNADGTYHLHVMLQFHKA